MPRAFWRGVISFGMVAIPVRMSIATQSKTLSFHYLHKKCHTRPKQVLYCPVDEEYFNVSETVRGYEYAKDQFVVFEDEDFEKVPVKTAHTIDILGFVDAKDIDLIYFAGSHYLEPEELGIKPFALLKAVLEKTRKVGIAKVAFQRREHLCCLRPRDNVIGLHTLHYEDEIIPAEAPAGGPPKLSQAELSMAEKLVEAMAASFKPEEYKDDYSLAISEVVNAKLQGLEIKAPEIPRIEVEDLMKALRESVAAAGKR